MALGFGEHLALDGTEVQKALVPDGAGCQVELVARWSWSPDGAGRQVELVARWSWSPGGAGR